MSSSLPLVIPLLLLPALPAGDGLFFRGRANGDATTDISDAVSILAWLFVGAAEPPCLDAADGNDDGRLDLSDAVRILAHLFQGGPPLPSPSPAEPCPGPDPTPDALGCLLGASLPGDVPAAAAYAAFANPPGVRERSRRKLPVSAGGSFTVEEGTAFEIVVEAASNRRSRSGFRFATEELPGADPDVLRVRCDRALGEPGAGGAAAGVNLAPWFLRETDGWEDPIYLVEHVSLRIAGNGPLAPAPGSHRFTASVVDADCAASPETTFTLEVLPSRAPEVFAWIEERAQPAGLPAPHDPGSGNPRLGLAESGPRLLVIEALPNGRAAGNPALAPDPASFTVAAMPPFASPGLFVRAPGAPCRFLLALDPEGVFPLPGNTDLEVSILPAGGGDRRSARFVIEREVSYAEGVQPIWNVHCTGCHERPDPEKGLELVSPGAAPAQLWRKIVNVYATEPEIESSAPYLVRPYYPEMSYLFRKIEGTHLDPGVGGEGVRMPQGAAVYLDADTRRRIESWILQGAPSN